MSPKHWFKWQMIMQIAVRAATRSIGSEAKR